MESQNQFESIPQNYQHVISISIICPRKWQNPSKRCWVIESILHGDRRISYNGGEQGGGRIEDWRGREAGTI